MGTIEKKLWIEKPDCLDNFQMQKIEYLFEVKVKKTVVESGGAQVTIGGKKDYCDKAWKYMMAAFRSELCICHIYDCKVRDMNKLMKKFNEAEQLSGCYIKKSDKSCLLVYGITDEEVAIAVSFLESVLSGAETELDDLDDSCMVIGESSSDDEDWVNVEFNTDQNALDEPMEPLSNYDEDGQRFRHFYHVSNNTKGDSSCQSSRNDVDVINLLSDEEPMEVTEPVKLKNKRKRKKKKKTALSSDLNSQSSLSNSPDLRPSVQCGTKSIIWHPTGILPESNHKHLTSDNVLAAQSTSSSEAFQFKRPMMDKLTSVHPSRLSNILSVMPSVSTAPNLTPAVKKELRWIVIDGSNVAWMHGRGKQFSCRGIELVTKYFQNRGHDKITVFVPQWRRSSKASPASINPEILEILYKKGLLEFTPSRKVGGKIISSYDDRFVLDLATDEEGIVVSNDQYVDLYEEEPRYRETIKKRVLQVTFVGDKVMFPADPLGRGGPNLDEFLRHKPHSSPISLKMPQTRARSTSAKRFSGSPNYQLPVYSWLKHFCRSGLTWPSEQSPVSSLQSQIAVNLMMRNHPVNSKNHDISNQHAASSSVCDRSTSNTKSHNRPPAVTTALRESLLRLPYGTAFRVDELLKEHPSVTNLEFFKRLL